MAHRFVRPSDLQEVLADDHRPRKCTRAASIHIWSVMAGSSGGTRCESTSILTPAACATRPASSAVVWWERMLCFRAGRIGDAGDQAIDARHVQRVVDEDVGALGELDEVVGRRGVPRDDDRAVRGVETIAERRHDRRVVYERGGDLDVLVLHDRAALAQFVDMDERNERHTALVGDARGDIVAFISKNSLVIFSSGGGPHVSTRVRSPAAHASRIRLP